MEMTDKEKILARMQAFEDGKHEILLSWNEIKKMIIRMIEEEKKNK